MFKFQLWECRSKAWVYIMLRKLISIKKTEGVTEEGCELFYYDMPDFSLLSRPSPLAGT